MGIHPRTRRDLSPCERWFGARICCLKVYTQAKFRVPLDPPLSLSTETPASGRGAGSAPLAHRTVDMECGRARTVSFRCER